VPVRALCLILDAMVLGLGPYPVNPEAAALTGTTHHLQAELARGRSGAALSLVAIEDESSAAAILALRGIAAAEVPSRPLAPGAAVDASVCAAGAEAAILVTRDGHRPTSGSVTRWILGDAYHGLEDVRDAGRRLREELGQPVPRTRNPASITGGLVLLPAGTPPETLLRAVYDHPAASWVHVGERAILYTENTDQEDRLAALPGAERISPAVNSGRLRVVSGEIPGAAETLYRAGAELLVLVPEGGDAPGTGWAELRFASPR
jgi:hypothetical protein